MSDLGTIFHVKKAGVQYDAHAYTTTDECPEPNLKVNFKGQQGYIKLEAKGSGDVPCYVKKSDGGVFQVKKEYVSITAGNFTIDCIEGNTQQFTVPKNITVIKVTANNASATSRYIGVTSGKTYKLTVSVKRQDTPPYPDDMLYRLAHANVVWYFADYFAASYVTLSWSAEINKETPTITDY